MSNSSSVEDLLGQVRLLREKYDALAAANGENFNVFQLLGMETDEVRTHSAILADLLDPRGSHGQGVARGTMLRDETTHDSVAAVLEELARPVWRDHYENYLRRMGVLPVTDWPNSHPGWATVLESFTALARELGLLRADSA